MGGRYPEWFCQYEILRVFEVGPRCDTLLARVHGPGGFRRVVVLKRYPPPGDEHEAQELAREARALALVSSPYIVQLHDFSLLDGQPLLVLEYVPGPSLAELANTLHARGEQLLDEAVLYIGHALFSALSAAHTRARPTPASSRPSFTATSTQATSACPVRAT